MFVFNIFYTWFVGMTKEYAKLDKNKTLV